MGVYKKSLTKAILLVLEKAVDGYVSLEDLLYNLSQALKRLREGGLIEQIKLKNDVLIKLTEDGKNLIGDKFEEKDWDRKWRIVIFDIPEEKRIIRNLFRRNLKKWGFKHLQKSVWISQRNVFDKLESYIKDLGIEKWVIVMEVNRLTAHTIL